MVTLRPRCALLRSRSNFHSSSPSARSRIQAAVPSAWPRMTSARVMLRLPPARTSCAPPRANKRRLAPVLVIGMPLKRSRSSGAICSAAQMPPGRNSAV
eukprot:6183297-Pleurochrysis_carterae.AAC.2